MKSFLKRLWTAAIGVLLVTTLVPAQIAHAATATPASYSVTRHSVSVSANHEFRFVTPTGVDAASDTIIFGYQGVFGLGAVTVGDIDLFHGPSTGLETNETLAAAAGVGTWGVAISATEITFTAPTNAAGGEISPNDIVTVRVGTNAAGGTNQITNPSTTQVAQILLGGTFGDSNTVAVPIIANDTVTVTATVAASSTGGGGGGGSGDTVPPQIFNVQVINITSSTASIIWNTDESSDSAVDYGLTVAYASGTVSNGGFVTSHQIDLANLSPNTTYHFQVKSRDGASNLATLGDFQFTTAGDVTPPIISNVQVINITDTSARVTWQTNEPATSRVDYGTSTSYGLSLSDPGLVFSHSIDITGLSPLTTYNFFVTSQDASGNTATSANDTFTTTGDATPPANPINFTAMGGDSVVHLSWTLPPDPDLAGVRIVRRTDTFPTGPLDGTLIYTGLGTATDDFAVTNGTTYFYAIFAFDTNGNYSSGALDSATPQANIVPEDNAAVCGNGIDDDGDGNADCADSGCASLPMCNAPQPENTPARCSNGIDDDQDGNADCQDSECAALQICTPTPPVPENTNARCSNGADDDQDGNIDCQDSDCAGIQVCMPVVPPNQPQQPIPSQPEPTPSGQTIVIHPTFYGAGGTVQLVPDASGEFGAPANSAVLIVVPVTELGALPDKAYATVNGSSYNLTPSADGTSYRGTFIAPGPGVYPVSVAMTFQGGGAAVANFTLRSQSGGSVVEEGVTGPTNVPVPGARVTLFVEQNGVWVVWNGALFGQANPQVLGPDGGFVFVVPNGNYYVQVEKEGYMTAVSNPRFISKGVFGERIGLVKVPPALPPNPTITDIVQNIADQAVFGATVIGEFLREPAVQETIQQTISPALLAIALLNIASALPLFNALAYLQYLFTQPLLLLGRRRKKKWGVVYNSLTKQPVELAIVRLLEHKTGLVVQTRVTDKYGRYSFIPKPGEYRLEVVKPGYVFPTAHLKGKEHDVDFSDLYHGTPIEAEKGFIIALNIPIDPIVAEETPRSVLFKKTFRSIQEDVALITVVASAIMLVVAPGVTIALITLGQVGMYLMFRRLSAPAAAKEWGIVFDPVTRKPLGGVVVRIFDKKFNKLLETQVTDQNGKYGFFVRRNVYYVTAEKQGYERLVSPDIDLSEKDEALVDQNLQLKPLGQKEAKK
ncbi:MAG: carboxypeptidase regulatory-like domain-containing protein [Patescibacteria group bacterium]